jgi:hypothetical protein
MKAKLLVHNFKYSKDIYFITKEFEKLDALKAIFKKLDDHGYYHELAEHKPAPPIEKPPAGAAAWIMHEYEIRAEDRAETEGPLCELRDTYIKIKSGDYSELGWFLRKREDEGEYESFYETTYDPSNNFISIDP